MPAKKQLILTGYLAQEKVPHSTELKPHMPLPNKRKELVQNTFWQWMKWHGSAISGLDKTPSRFFLRCRWDIHRMEMPHENDTTVHSENSESCVFPAAGYSPPFVVVVCQLSILPPTSPSFPRKICTAWLDFLIVSPEEQTQTIRAPKSLTTNRNSKPSISPKHLLSLAAVFSKKPRDKNVQHHDSTYISLQLCDILLSFLQFEFVIINLSLCVHWKIIQPGNKTIFSAALVKTRISSKTISPLRSVSPGCC